MTDRERFLACLLGEPVDRPPYWLFWSPWGTTWKRWELEGKPPAAENHQSLFGVDHRPASVPVNCGPCPRLSRTVIEEDDEFVTFTDTWGIKRRNFKSRESMSEFLEFPVRSRRDWEKFREERLDPDHPGRLDGVWRDQCAAWTAAGTPVQLGYFPDVGVFGGVRWLLGDEDGLIAFYTDPGLVHEIMDHLTSVYLTTFEKVVREVRVDVIHIWEDMCGRQGPLISPCHFDEFMAPNYRRIHSFARSHGIRLISVDSDGTPDRLIPSMMDAGINYLFPFEVAAGCDVNRIRERYPNLGMMGGIDKRALAVGPRAIDAELARIRPAMEKGRYIPDLDHLVPDDVSWDNYRYYAEALRKMIGKT